MRFRTQKIRSEERNWSVILNPLKSELDKKRVSEKISKFFGLSFEEARELVQSTPVILLDELPEPVALQARSLFQEVRADAVTLTNDSLVKRRCYRAVWPEPPSLSFLENPASLRETPGEAVPEIPVGTTVETVSPPPVPEPLDARREVTDELERKYRDLEQLYEERTREFRELKQNLEKEIPWEERFAHLKEESHETKAILEEKRLRRERECESLKTPLKQMAAWQE